MDNANFGEAVDVLELAMKTDGNDKRFTQNLGYLAQEWAKTTFQKEGSPKAEAVLASLLKRFPSRDWTSAERVRIAIFVIHCEALHPVF